MRAGGTTCGQWSFQRQPGASRRHNPVRKRSELKRSQAELGVGVAWEIGFEKRIPLGDPLLTLARASPGVYSSLLR